MSIPQPDRSVKGDAASRSWQRELARWERDIKDGTRQGKTLEASVDRASQGAWQRDLTRLKRQSTVKASRRLAGPGPFERERAAAARLGRPLLSPEDAAMLPDDMDQFEDDRAAYREYVVQVRCGPTDHALGTFGARHDGYSLHPTHSWVGSLTTRYRSLAERSQAVRGRDGRPIADFYKREGSQVRPVERALVEGRTVRFLCGCGRRRRGEHRIELHKLMALFEQAITNETFTVRLWD